MDMVYVEKTTIGFYLALLTADWLFDFRDSSVDRVSTKLTLTAGSSVCLENFH